MKSNKNIGKIKPIILGGVIALVVIFIVVAQLWKNGLLPSGDNLWSSGVPNSSTANTNSTSNGDGINVPKGFVGVG